MDIGVREAKSNLSKLVASVRKGEKIYLTNRGRRVAELVPASTDRAWRRGYGMFEGKVNLYPGWDSPDADAPSLASFEVLTGRDGQ
jgi:prevent-host-death family protein